MCDLCLSCSFQPRVIKVLNLWQKNGTFSTEVIQPLHQLAPQGGWSGVWQWGMCVVCLRVSCGVLAGAVGYECVAMSVCCMIGTDVRRYVCGV